MPRALPAFFLWSTLVTLGSCKESEQAAAPPTIQLVFDSAADLRAPEHFYDMPFPSDARETEAGHVDWKGFPNPRKNSTVAGFLALADNHAGTALLPVVHFQFTAQPAAVSPDTVWPAEASAPYQIVDVDPTSPERGRRVPVVAATAAEDVYSAPFGLSMAPAPGNLLRPDTRYAALVLNSVQAPTIDEPPVLEAAALSGRSGTLRSYVRAPAFSAALDQGVGTWGEALKPLRTQWTSEGKSLETIVAATVFTTGTPVENTAALSDAALAKYSVTIENLTLVTDAARKSALLCEFSGTVRYPQFQKGTAPYDTEGQIVVDDAGVPVKQGEEVAPIRIAMPRTAMPAAGYPLVLTVHGTGGRSDALVAPSITEDDAQVFGVGTAFPLAELGLASAGSAMPQNKERVPNGPADDQVNPNNLAALGHTFRQGVIESRLYLSALLALRIPANIVASCTGASLPSGVTAAKFDEQHVYMTGQSAGGMYTTMVAAVEPRLRAVVPTGGGGYFAFQFLKTTIVKNAQAVVQTLLGSNIRLTHLHPALGLAEAGLEPGDPIAFARRVGFSPLPGKAPVSVFQPGAPGDRYFPIQVYDALAVSYTHPYAGALVWPELGVSLAQRGLGGVSLPLTDNLIGTNGAYTGAIGPLAPVPGKDPHQIVFASEPLRHQLSCFFYTQLRTGKATILAPDDVRATCGVQ